MACIPFVNLPRFDLSTPCTQIQDCLERIPEWTLAMEMEFMQCSRNVHPSACITFHLQCGLCPEDIVRVQDMLAPKSALIFKTAVQLLLDVLEKKRLATCDIVACIQSTHDSARHARMIEYIHRVFLFVGRAFVGIRNLIAGLNDATLLVTMDRVVRHVLASYTNWLYHISFYTHIFSTASLNAYLRFGCAWIKHVMSKSSSSSISSHSGTHNGSHHIFDHAHTQTILMSALQTRMLELTDLHGRMISFLAVRGRPLAENTSFSFTPEEQDRAKEFVFHLGNVYESQQTHARLIDLFVRSSSSSASSSSSSSSASSSASTTTTNEDIKRRDDVHLMCVSQWAEIIHAQLATTSVLFFALIAMYAERKQQNISLAAFVQFEGLLRTYVDINKRLHESAKPNIARCITVVAPPEFKVDVFIGNVFKHKGNVSSVMQDQIAKLQKLNPDNMPLITNVQPHTTLNMQFSEWETKKKALTDELYNVNVGFVCIGFVCKPNPVAQQDVSSTTLVQN